MLICRADVNELTVGAKAFKARVWAHVSAVVAVFDKGLKFHCSNVPEGGKDDKELRAGGVGWINIRVWRKYLTELLACRVAEMEI